MENICIAVGVTIVMDIVCGVIGAAKNHVLDSSVMREGMYNKVGEILLVIVALMCHYWLEQPPFDVLGIPAEVTSLVGVYLVGMELLSIIENICKINPDLPFAKILYIFNLDNDDSDDVESSQASEE